VCDCRSGAQGRGDHRGLDYLGVGCACLSCVTAVDIDAIRALGSQSNGDSDQLFVVDDLGVWTRNLSSIEAYTIMWDYARSFDMFGPVLLVIRRNGTNYELIWQSGTLQEADTLAGPWTAVQGASAPYFVINSTPVRKFYRVQL